MTNNDQSDTFTIDRLHSIFLEQQGESNVAGASVISRGSTSNQALWAAITWMKEALDEAKHNLVNAQEQMKQRVDRAKCTKEWTVGDQVLLNT